MINQTEPIILENQFKDFGLLQMSLDAKVEEYLNSGKPITEPIKIIHNGLELSIRPAIKPK